MTNLPPPRTTLPVSKDTTVVRIVRLIDANKAKLAFLAPLVVALGSSAASWVITGNFSATEIRTAASGAILGAVSAAATWLAPAKQAEVSTLEITQKTSKVA